MGRIRIDMPALGRVRLRGPTSGVILPGRLVTTPNAVLRVGDGIFVAQRPDHLLRFDGERLFGQASETAVAVGAIAVACDGRCLLTAASPSAKESFLWRLSPFEPTPMRLVGQVFLDRGEAALDCAGRTVLLRGNGTLSRLNLPVGTKSGPSTADVEGTEPRLTGDGRMLYLRDGDLGWRILDVTTMRARPRPDWLTKPPPR